MHYRHFGKLERICKTPDITNVFEFVSMFNMLIKKLWQRDEIYIFWHRKGVLWYVYMYVYASHVYVLAKASWRHEMETFSALLSLCFFLVSLNKLFNTHSIDR